MTRGSGTRACDGGIVTGWLLRLGTVLAVIGVAAFDAISVGVCRMATADDAASAAAAAASTWSLTHRTDLAYADALARARRDDPAAQVPVDAFRVDRDGTVHLVVRRTARTLVVARIGPLRSVALAEEAGTAVPSP